MRTLAMIAIVAGAACGPQRGGGDDDGVVDAARMPDARRAAPIPPDCLAAADRGLAWLVTQQKADGSWGSTNYEVGTTGFAVLKLETYAAEIGRSPFDPGFLYAAQVAKGLAFLFGRVHPVSVTPQPAGNPDSNGNGYGIRFANLMYENTIALMAVVAGGEPDRKVMAPGSLVDGFPYRVVAREAVDYFAFAQSDSPRSTPPTSCTRGGWRYGALDHDVAGGDNSVTAFVALALEYARHPTYRFEIEPPAWVSSELRQWTTCVQNVDGGADAGGAGYQGPADGPAAYNTGALLQELAFLGDSPNSPAATAAVRYLSRTWTDVALGWRNAPVSDYLTMYVIMKGMESLALTDLSGVDWYREMCDQLKAEQQADGSWPAANMEMERVGNAGLNSTEWALLVLERVAPPPEID